MTGLVVLLVLMAALADRASILARVPLNKPRAVLIDRADRAAANARLHRARRRFRVRLLLRRAVSHLGGEPTRTAQNNGTRSSTGRPAALVFWYRSSPDTLVPYDRRRSVSTGDPPLITRGMVRIDLDTEGRLLIFRAVPSLEDAPLATPWTGMRCSRPRGSIDRGSPRPSRRCCRARMPTNGKRGPATFPEAPDMPIRIEAAAFRGRPTMFEILGSWVPLEGGAAAPETSPAVWRDDRRADRRHRADRRRARGAGGTSSSAAAIAAARSGRGRLRSGPASITYAIAPDARRKSRGSRPHVRDSRRDVCSGAASCSSSTSRSSRTSGGRGRPC